MRARPRLAESSSQAASSREPERVADVLRGALRKAFVRDRAARSSCNPDDLDA